MTEELVCKDCNQAATITIEGFIIESWYKKCGCSEWLTEVAELDDLNYEQVKQKIQGGIMLWKIRNNKWWYFKGGTWRKTQINANLCGMECVAKHFPKKDPEHNCKTKCPFGMIYGGKHE